MKHLRRSAIALLLALTVLLGIERLLSDGPWLGGIHTYLLIVEIALVLIALWLAWSLLRGLGHVEHAAKDVLLFGIKHRLRRLDEAGPEVQAEFARSRRYHRPLSIVVVNFDFRPVPAEPSGDVPEAPLWAKSYFASASLIRVIGSQIRRTDLILEPRELGRVLILCPETDATAATKLANRLRAVAQSHGVPVTCGIATFPDEALTFEGLVRQASVRLAPAGGTIPFPTGGAAQRPVGSYVRYDLDLDESPGMVREGHA